MENLSTAERLMSHLNKNAKAYYAPVIAETNRVLAQAQYLDAMKEVAATTEKSLVKA